jgi:3' exoribonuclease, RNase T-like
MTDQTNTEDAVAAIPTEWGFMADTETVGLSETAGVLQLAIVPFLLTNPLAHYPGRQIQLSLQPQLEMGRTIDGSTLKFWLDQEKEGQAPLLLALDGGDRDTIVEALQTLSIWAASWKQNATRVELWSKGAGFDPRILKNLFAQYAVEWPFEFREERDLRTLMALAGMNTASLTRTLDEKAHTALGDCRFQIRQYAAGMNILKPQPE